MLHLTSINTKLYLHFIESVKFLFGEWSFMIKCTAINRYNVFFFLGQIKQNQIISCSFLILILKDSRCLLSDHIRHATICLSTTLIQFGYQRLCSCNNHFFFIDVNIQYKRNKKWSKFSHDSLKNYYWNREREIKASECHSRIRTINK